MLSMAISESVQVDHTETAFPKTVAEVDLLVEQEVPRVEAFILLEDKPGHNEQGSHDPVNLAIAKITVRAPLKQGAPDRLAPLKAHRWEEVPSPDKCAVSIDLTHASAPKAWPEARVCVDCLSECAKRKQDLSIRIQ